MGINSIEALRGNRVMLRGIHLNEKNWKFWELPTPVNKVCRKSDIYRKNNGKHSKGVVQYGLHRGKWSVLLSTERNDTPRREGMPYLCLPGQRFIAAGMSSKRLEIDGIPGNALGAYLGGGSITVNGNAQDAVGDTMSAGRIVIHGSTGDAAGYGHAGR